MESLIIDIGMYLTYAMLAIAAIAAIAFPVVYLVQDPKKAKASLYGVLGLAVIFVVSYLISSNELYKEVQDPVTSKLVGGGIIMFYILFVASILTAVYSEIAKIFK
jgi:inner membrane protein involved in colicin E2 resistance